MKVSSFSSFRRNSDGLLYTEKGSSAKAMVRLLLQHKADGSDADGGLRYTSLVGEAMKVVV